MERFCQRKPWEKFEGDWQLFKTAVNSDNNCFIYDLDGVLVYSALSVFEDFAGKTGITVRPSKIDGWEYLTNIAKEAKLDKSVIEDPEAGWYKPDILGQARRYSYTRPLVNLTMDIAGPENNFTLTSRDSSIDKMKDETDKWLDRHFKDFSEDSRLIWDPRTGVSAAKFKSLEIEKRAWKYDWVIFMDDSGEFTKAAFQTEAHNILVVNTPQGVVRPDFVHDRLVTIGRYPEESQSMYPLYWALKKAIFEGKST